MKGAWKSALNGNNNNKKLLSSLECIRKRIFCHMRCVRYFFLFVGREFSLFKSNGAAGWRPVGV